MIISIEKKIFSEAVHIVSRFAERRGTTLPVLSAILLSPLILQPAMPWGLIFRVNNMQNLLSKLPGNIRMILISVLPLAVTGILFLVVGQFGISKISQVRDQTTKSQQDEATLSQKLTLLSDLSEIASTGSDLSATALPDSNPALTVISQIKNLAVQHGVIISSTKSGAEIKDNSGLSRVDVTFDADAGRSQIFAFVEGIELLAPITLVDKIKINELGGVARATVSVKSFWAAFPKTLPALNQPLSDLTSSEKKTLGDISKLTQPGFINIPPSEISGKPDPFSP